MMHKVFQTVPRSYAAFLNRVEAGRRLVEALKLSPDPDAAVVAVPRGGVLVAEPVARALAVPIDLVLVRKLPVPASPEAGFGAVAIDGSRVLNPELLHHVRLAPAEIDRIAERVMVEVRRRAESYVGHDRPPEVAGKRVYVVDDGLASGYTVIAAAIMLGKLNPAALFLCVPCSPLDSIARVEPHFDEIVCLVAQAHLPFAVASYFADFSDPADEDVRNIVRRSREPPAGGPPGEA